MSSADPGHRVDPHPLRIAFDYDPLYPVAVDDQVEIGASRKVAKLTAANRHLRVGQVDTVRSSLYEAVVKVPHAENRQDRIAGEDMAIGLFAWGANNTVFQATPAARASHTGTTTGPKTITVDTDDTTKIKVDGTSITTTLTAGTDVAFATIAAEINADLAGHAARVVVNAAGNLVLEATEMGKTVEVEAVATDAYTLLGWTAAVYYPTNASHDPSEIGGLIVVGGSEGEAVETLEF